LHQHTDGHDSAEHGAGHGPTHGPTHGTHNQMVVGRETVYLSHLPMFGHPQHGFQVILEVGLSGPGDPHAAYVADRAAHPDVRMYTMSPEPLEILEFDPQQPRRRAMRGSIFRGHLERPMDQAPLLEGVVAEVVNTVHFRRLDENAPPLPQLEYLLFGKAPDLFLAHVITRPPDFDQILSVELLSGAPSAEALRRGMRVSVPGRANTPPTRIAAGEQIEARAESSGAATEERLRLRAGTELYFEEGELGDPRIEEGQPGAFTMAPTPEEQRAGFN
jgi:hypothetical protein